MILHICNQVTVCLTGTGIKDTNGYGLEWCCHSGTAERDAGVLLRKRFALIVKTLRSTACVIVLVPVWSANTIRQESQPMVFSCLWYSQRPPTAVAVERRTSFANPVVVMLQASSWNLSWMIGPRNKGCSIAHSILVKLPNEFETPPRHGSESVNDQVTKSHDTSPKRFPGHKRKRHEIIRRRNLTWQQQTVTK